MRIYHFLILVVFILLQAFTALGQSVLLPRSAVWQYAAGLAGWTDDAFARYRHPAMPAAEGRPALGFQGESYAGVRGTAMLSAVFSGSVGTGAFGLGFDHRSFPGAGESRVGIGYALPLSGRLRVGLRTGYHQLRVPGHAVEMAIPVDFGLSFRQERISVGFAVSKPVSFRTKTDDPRGPALFRVSAVWSPSETAGLAMDVVREDGWGVSGRPMVWYRPGRDFRVVCGMVVDEASAFLGLNYRITSMGVDLFFERHVRMGWTGAFGFVHILNGGMRR
jgi:hypothetical protein